MPRDLTNAREVSAMEARESYRFHPSLHQYVRCERCTKPFASPSANHYCPTCQKDLRHWLRCGRNACAPKALRHQQEED